MDGEARDIIEKLALVPHVEGGWYRFIWSGGLAIPRASLPARYSGERGCVSLIYYMLEGADISAWHKLHSDEIWVWHKGGSLCMTLGGTGPGPQAEQELYLGPRYARGESFQILAPAETWQTTKILDGSFALVSCIVSPAFHKDDFLLYKPSV